MARTPVRRLAVALLLLSSASLAGPAPLIPRRALLANPEARRPALSPDGTRLAWIEKDRGGGQIWLQTLGKEDLEPLVENQQRSIHSLTWAEDSRALLFAQASDDAGNDHLFRVDLEKNVRDLTPFQGVRARLLRTSPRLQDQVLVTMNREARSRRDVYRLDLTSGALTLQARDPGTVVAWAAGDDLVVRVALVELPDGARELQVLDRPGAPWRTLTRVGPDDLLSLVGLGPEGRSVLYVSSAGGETGRVVQRALKGGPEKVLAHHREVDPEQVWMHPVRHVVQGVLFESDRPRWTLLDPTVKKDVDVLVELARGVPVVLSRDRADGTWVVAFRDPQSPTRLFSFDRTTLQGKPLLEGEDRLDPESLAPVGRVRFVARDGMRLNGFLTRPVGQQGPGPLVLVARGWPGTQTQLHFDPLVQLLANRGYSVLQVNTRGSVGYGRTLLRAGNRQLGKAIQTDLLDAVAWAANAGVADRSRVCIVGGYATLAAAVFSPDAFRCGVDLSGPADLVSYLRSAPEDRRERGRQDRRLGNPDDPADRALLESVSPVYFLDRIAIPLLIAQGGKDTRVTPEASAKVVAALEEKGVPVTYVLYPDEGQVIARADNRSDLLARAEAFLARHLGGRVEPMEGERVAGSSAVVKVVPTRAAAVPE